jgi:hypothetical protein
MTAASPTAVAIATMANIEGLVAGIMGLLHLATDQGPPPHERYMTGCQISIHQADAGDRRHRQSRRYRLLQCGVSTHKIREVAEKSRQINTLAEAHVILTCVNAVSMVRAAF